ncbi:MAG TPA: sulfur carrier protein ThiS [Pyrinomonadaceae bacterium]
MKIKINGEIKELEKALSLSQILELFSLPAQRVAVELNRRVVRKQDWSTTIVEDDDRIEVVHFVGGG